MDLYLIRHGESVSNAEGRIQGQLDVPLSDFGRRQAEAIAERLGGESIEAIISSPLKRAWETAEVSSRRLGLPIISEPRLKEINVGIFQGKTREELKRTHAKELELWHSEDLDFVVPGGESRRQLIARAEEALGDAAKLPYKRIAVFAHGRLLIGVVKHISNMSPKEPPFSLQNGSITIVTAGPEGTFTLRAMDQISHLREVGLSGSGDI